MFFQELAELAGVEVVAVVRYGGKLRGAWLLGCFAVTAKQGLKADRVRERGARVGQLPARGEIGFAVAMGQDEGMKIMVGDAAVDPAVKARSLLEGGIALPEEF